MLEVDDRYFPQVDFKCIFVNRNTIGPFFQRAMKQRGKFISLHAMHVLATTPF